MVDGEKKEEADLKSQSINSVLLGRAWTVHVPNSKDLIYHIMLAIN